jgi:hypothetical protein
VAPSGPGMDRAGMVALVQQYVRSLPEHSAAGLPLAPNVKFTEQAVPIPIGDGLWLSATSGPTGFQVWLGDPVSGQAGFYGVLGERDKPVVVAARIKVENGKITEIENVIVRGLDEASLKNFETPRPAFGADVPANERTPRARMFEIAESYFDAIEQDNGELCPFADESVRHENGSQANLSDNPPTLGGDFGASAVATAWQQLCRMRMRDNLSTGAWTYITQIRPRHILICDEDKGIVASFPRFVHRGDVRQTKLRGVAGVTEMPFGPGPSDLQCFEMFKIRAGKVYEVEAAGFANAYLAPTGWEAEYPETYNYEITHPWQNPRQPPNPKRYP